MTERERPLTDRRSILRRQLAANAYWGIDSTSHCHDVVPRRASVPSEPTEDEDGYVVVFDRDTGEITVKPVSE